MRDKPDAFHATEHYAGAPYVLVRLAAVTGADLAEVLAVGWGEVVPSELVEREDEVR